MVPYIETILNAFCSFDIENLRLHFKDEYSYQDAPKDVFLRELEKVFLNFQNAEIQRLQYMREGVMVRTCPNFGKGVTGL